MRGVIIQTVVVFCAMSASSFVLAQEAAQADAPCGHAAFASLVSESGGELSAMNEQKRRSFMEKLQALKVQEQWSDADYATNARPFVQDEKIAAFDVNSKILLTKVQSLGGGDSITEEKRCMMLGELKGLLGDMVKNTREKWDYMLAKLSGALKPVATAAEKGS
jgi:hypothetical protein